MGDDAVAAVGMATANKLENCLGSLQVLWFASHVVHVSHERDWVTEGPAA